MGHPRSQRWAVLLMILDMLGFAQTASLQVPKQLYLIKLLCVSNDFVPEGGILSIVREFTDAEPGD